MPDDTARDLAALERERLEADRRYNDALTAVDRAIVRPAARASTISAPTTTMPLVPSGWRGRLLRIVADWLAPVLVEQQTFNARLASEVTRAAARERETAVALEQFQTALVVFLQQITAFVDTRVRAADGAASMRIAAAERTIDSLADVQAQVQTLQRIVQSLKRRQETNNAGVGNDQRSEGAAAISPTDTADVAYVGFEDRFRGSDDEIRERQAAYLPVFEGAADVLDIGCGRGEFLALLQSKGIGARGIDANGEMAAVARERGLEAAKADALRYAGELPDESLGGVMCAQVVEHLEPAYLIRLLETLSHKLRAGSPVVFETINPACWLAFFSSYIRDFTHVRPIHPETLKYLLEASGFGRVSIRYSAPVPEHAKMAAIDLPAALLSSDDAAARALVDASRVVNANSAILNNLLFTYMDYAAIAIRV